MTAEKNSTFDFSQRKILNPNLFLKLIFAIIYCFLQKHDKILEPQIQKSNFIRLHLNWIIFDGSDNDIRWVKIEDYDYKLAENELMEWLEIYVTSFSSISYYSKGRLILKMLFEQRHPSILLDIHVLKSKCPRILLLNKFGHNK